MSREENCHSHILGHMGLKEGGLLMELFEVLKFERRSVRKFADRPVEEERIMQV